jgi:hypothetical protein
MLTIIASCEQMSPQTNTALFMGLADNEEVKIGDEAPESALASIAKITTVQVRPYEEYVKYKATGKILREERHGPWLYWSVNVDRDVPFPNGTSAWCTVTERCKSEIP